MNITKAWGYYNLAKTVLKRAEEKLPIQITDNQAGPYRPPQWDSLPAEVSQLVLVKTNIGGFFFDAVLREEHTSSLRITSHPVQTGANITDHSFVEPKMLTMDIIMSDAVDSFVLNQFSGDNTKSVNAYKTLINLQESRIPVSVLTRLALYDNMLIENISAPDDYKSLNGLRCTVTLREIFVVEVTKTKVSARPHDTDFTDRGTVQPQIVEYDPGTGVYQGEQAIKG